MPSPSTLLIRSWVWALFVSLVALFAPFAANAGDQLSSYLQKVQPSELFTGADSYGPLQGEPPIAPVLRTGVPLGYAYLNSDFTASTGYSGKPIHIVVGITSAGVVSGIKLVDHKEPIVLIGIPQSRVVAALNSIIGKDLGRVAAGVDRPPQVDIVSGATVTVLVMGDSVIRSAVKLIRSHRLDTQQAAETPATAEIRSVDNTKSGVRDWQTLIGDGSIRSLRLTVGEVSDAFRAAKQDAAANNPETTPDTERFIDFYVAPVSVPVIGRSLLGDALYDRLRSRLKPDQSAILVAGDGAYSFKGSGYVRGGIFDRIELLQDGQGVRFHDHDHTRIPTLAAAGAPKLREIALFQVPKDFTFDVTAPFELQLLVQRTMGAQKAVLPYNVGYSLPDIYVKTDRVNQAQPPATAVPPQDAPVEATGSDIDNQLWITIWQASRTKIAVTLAAILTLTAIFFFQDWLVRRPKLFGYVRTGFLLFTLFWLGWYANAQLSVVNVLTFANAVVSGFNWQFFLAAPLIFLLWAAGAAALLFWGRGPFCGWLCPFGALQELTNNLAKKLGVPQVKLPWGLHERLWPVKYIIFLGLFGVSFYSTALAEQLSEIEPFKTAIILKFARQWPFVLFALFLLVAGLFVERFYCRYLCPLGAALAIPGRIRMFEWLKRWPECGSPCQRCSKECPVQAIHPEGQINVNECIYCMHCQELYQDDQRCPHMIQVRLKREKFMALSTPESRGETPAKKQKVEVTYRGAPIKKTETSSDHPA
jgi:NosR/NirI family nitrous oxide reductase transcriptional regulator